MSANRGPRRRPGEPHQQADPRPAGRRSHGAGGIVAIADGVWRVDVEIAADPVTGARRRVSRRVRGSRVDAEVALARLRVADHDGRLPRPGTRARSVGAALEEYLHDARIGVVELAPKTVVTTRSAVTTMSKTVLADGRRFGDVSLAQLSWQDIEALFRAMKLAGSGVAWIRRSATVLSRALDRARKHGLIETNPAKDAARPKMIRSKPHSPLKADLVDLFAELADVDAEIADAAVILAGTGMRMGELLGLQWSNVHLGQRQVNVSWAITDGGPGVGVLRKETKRSDWRDVPLTSGSIAAFRRQAERCTAGFGVTPSPGFYVFPGRTGPDMPHRPDTFGDRFADARGADTTTFLHLRHYAATSMLDAGEDYRTVADILGNSETTLRLHYDGRTNIDKRRAISALEFS